MLNREEKRFITGVLTHAVRMTNSLVFRRGAAAPTRKTKSTGKISKRSKSESSYKLKVADAF